MKNFEKLSREIACGRGVAATLKEHHEAIKNPRVDKHGKGFNKDRRFSSAQIQLSVDSWTGEYGSSSCGTSIRISDPNLFGEVLVELLNEKFDSILLEVAERIEKRATRNIEKAKEELSAAMAALDKIAR